VEVVPTTTDWPPQEAFEDAAEADAATVYWPPEGFEVVAAAEAPDLLLGWSDETVGDTAVDTARRGDDLAESLVAESLAVGAADDLVWPQDLDDTRLLPTDLVDLRVTIDPTDPPTAQLSLRGVNKIYPGHPPLHVLKNICVDIEAGEFVAVVGPSGSGKTTMLSIMGTLDQPTAGEVWLDGVNAAAVSEVERARLRSDVVGFVFQQFFLLPALTALDNVATGMLYQGLNRAERRRRALIALDRVGLAARAGHRPGELSGGEQQRVAIARAIAGDPQILFADEPTGALDQTSGLMIVDYLRAISVTGTTVIVITHDHALAARFDRTITLIDGAIVGDEPAQIPAWTGVAA
jgi:putative ABC transport system ATP-binding protein